MKARSSDLQVLASHPRQIPDLSFPILHLLVHPLHLWPGVSNITPQVADLCDDSDPSPPGEYLRLHDLCLGEDQDTIGWLQEVPPGGGGGGGGGAHHYVVHMGKDVLEGQSHSCINGVLMM